MASSQAPDIRQALRPLERATVLPPPPSAMAHSRQMSSLSMTTFTTASQSHQPSEPLLRSPEHQDVLSRQPLTGTSSQDRGCWDKVHMRRVRRWRLLRGALLSIMGSWASYMTVRYFIAYVVYSGSARRSVALTLGISSFLSVIFVAALAVSFVLPYHVAQDHPRLRFFSYVFQFLVSFLLFAPTVVNLVLVPVWRHSASSVGLRGRCHWNLDVVWAGVGGQCANHAPAFGVWLTAAIVRLLLTAVVLVAYHIASRTYRALRWSPSYHPEDVRRIDTVDIIQIAQRGAPSRPSPMLHPFFHKNGGSSNTPQHSLSSSRSRMAAIPESQGYAQEYAGLDTAEIVTLSEEDSNPRSTESGTTLPRPLQRSKSFRDMHAGEGSSRHATLPSDVGEGELQGFADRFRDLVDRVSRELEEARILESRAEQRTPPLHHVLDTHAPYMSIDEFGREVPSEEPIAMLGGVIRRMPTIESVGSREVGSLRSATLINGNPGGVGFPSGATSSTTSSRPPTRATVASFNDAASASLASASQPSSRSNSLHLLRMPTELGELVRDAIRARAQTRPLTAPLAARPGSGGSLSGGSGSGCCGGGAESLQSRSRSNSLGANEVLAPVTEHGELGLGLGREEMLPQLLRGPPPPEQYLAAGRVGANEMGEFMRTEWSRSWTNSSPSVTSTAYFTAGTSGSASGGGGDTGLGGNDKR